MDVRRADWKKETANFSGISSKNFRDRVSVNYMFNRSVIYDAYILYSSLKDNPILFTSTSTLETSTDNETRIRIKTKDSRNRSNGFVTSRDVAVFKDAERSCQTH